MVIKVESKELDEFCTKLFRALDGLGLLPLHLWAKPNEFEKHPRLLFGSIQRYNDVEAGFREWETIVFDTRASLVSNAAYYHKVLQGKEHTTLSQEEMEIAEDAERSQEEVS